MPPFQQRTNGFSNRAARRKHMKQTGEKVEAKNKPFVHGTGDKRRG